MQDPAQTVAKQPRRGKLRGKFERAILLITGVLAIATLAVVVSLSVRTSKRHLEEIRTQIESGIERKAAVLVASHAIALKNMALDNAFSDVESLIAKAVADDDDVLYGTFVDATGRAWAYTAPDRKPAPPKKDGEGQAAQAPLPPDAWKALGLSPASYTEKKGTSRRAVLFGEEVLEVSLPVLDGEELLGTVRYGLSLARMQRALQEASAKSRADLYRAVGIFVALPFGTLLIGLLLARSVAGRVTKPLSELSRAAHALAEGQRAIRVNITSNDEVEELGDSFNRMAVDLQSSYESLEAFSRDLERKVEERTRELAGRNRDMRLVLDNVDQGFVTLDATGRMAREHSAVMDLWFGAYSEELPLWAYLRPVAPEFADSIEFAWEQLESGFLPFELCVEQLPRRLSADNRCWEFRFVPLGHGESLEGMLVIIAEITQLLAQQREEAEQREVLGIFRRLMRDRSGFLSFLAETNRMVAIMECGAETVDRVLLKRTIHTLKGNAGLYGLEVVATLCHELETSLEDTGDTPLQDLFEPLLVRWKELSESINSFTAGDDDSTIEVRRDDFHHFLQALDKRAPHQQLRELVDLWQLEPVVLPLERLGEQAVALATRLGKGKVSVRIAPCELRLPADAWAPLWADFAHVIRNAVDHGFKTSTSVPPGLRAATIPPEKTKHIPASLPATASLLPLPRATATSSDKLRAVNPNADSSPTLSLRAQKSMTAISIEISDNGQGIQWERVARKAKELGLPHEGQAALLEALMADGVTTADAVSEISGRGVGMAAVKQRVREMGGSIEVESKAGQGTLWRFVFPLAKLPKEYLKV